MVDIAKKSSDLIFCSAKCQPPQHLILLPTKNNTKPRKRKQDKATKRNKGKNMATIFLPNANAFLPSSSSSSSSSSSTAYNTTQNQSIRRQFVICKAVNDPSLSPAVITKRRSICLSVISTFLLGLGGRGCSDANAAILEAEDDEELLEKVKKDRKKRLERQGVISSSSKETGYLQDLVYKLSKVGQAIENNDLSAASLVLAQSTNTEWVQKISSAFSKLSPSNEAKSEADIFNSSLESLISSVSKNDIEASKSAFVASAIAFEKWTELSGLDEQLKGL